MSNPLFLSIQDASVKQETACIVGGSPPRVPFLNQAPCSASAGIQPVWIIPYGSRPAPSGTNHKEVIFPYRVRRQGETRLSKQTELSDQAFKTY